MTHVGILRFPSSAENRLSEKLVVDDKQVSASLDAVRW